MLAFDGFTLNSLFQTSPVWKRKYRQTRLVAVFIGLFRLAFEFQEDS